MNEPKKPIVMAVPRKSGKQEHLNYTYALSQVEVKKGSAWYYFKGKVLAYFYVRKIKRRIKGEQK